MAMTDYFKKNACDKITQTETANAHFIVALFHIHTALNQFGYNTL